MRERGLDHSIGFLLGIASRKMSHLFMMRIKEYDLTPEQWSVLFRISEQDGLIQKDIADRSGKDKPTTTRILDTLESKGYITKRAGLHDRRSFHVFITEQGKQIAKVIEPIEQETIDNIAHDFSDEEYTQLVGMLSRLISRATELADIEKEKE